MIIKDRASLTRLIKSASAVRGISIKNIGDALNVSGPSISRTINRADIPISTLIKIADALNMDIDIQFKERG